MSNIITEQIKTRHIPNEYDINVNESYKTKQERQLKRIELELRTNDDFSVVYGKNWIKLNGKIYNGVTKEMFEKILKSLVKEEGE